MSDKHWAVEASETMNLIAEESALMTLNGIGVNEQVKQLKRRYPGPDVTRSKLVSLRKHPKYKEILVKEAEQMIDTGQVTLKAGAAGLVPEVLKCLKSKLQEGDVKAAVAVFNILADKDSDEGTKVAQQLNITLASDVVKEVK